MSSARFPHLQLCPPTSRPQSPGCTPGKLLVTHARPLLQSALPPRREIHLSLKLPARLPLAGQRLSGGFIEGLSSVLPQPRFPGTCCAAPKSCPPPRTTFPVSHVTPPNMVMVGAVHPLSSEFSRKSPLPLGIEFLAPRYHAPWTTH